MPTDLPADAGDRPFRRSDLTWAAVVAAVGCVLTQLLQVRLGLSLGDETWAWYGVQRTMAGDWPLRDFQAYDPGRYLLWAGWLRLLHTDRLVPLRVAMALLQWTALVPANLLVLRTVPRRWLLWPAGLALALWVAPRHKTIDVNAIAWTTFALTALVRRPTAGRHRLAGLTVGLLWLVGRNHVLYATASTAAVVAATWAVDRGVPLWRRAAWVAQGGAVGVLPMVLVLLAVPGYPRAYWDVVVWRQVEIGATNLTLPVPWPWARRPPSGTWDGWIARATGGGFVLMIAGLLAAAAALVRVARQGRLRRHAVLLAATAATVGWANHAFSRADLPHLAQAGLPLVVLLIALPAAVAAGWRRTAVTAAVVASLAVVTVVAMPDLNPALSAVLHPDRGDAWTTVGGEPLRVPAQARAIVAVADRVVGQLRPGESALLLPYDPGLYAVYRLKCPMFESYPVYPATAAEQRRAVAAIAAANVARVLYWPDRIDGRPDLGLDQTDPLVWQYVRDHFDLAETVPDAGGVQVWRRRPSAAAATRHPAAHAATRPAAHAASSADSGGTGGRA